MYWTILLQIGIIGGSGLDDPDILVNRQEIVLTTPFGKPSDALITGLIGEIECVLLARHGRHHNIMPSNVNYRANIWAMRMMQCTHLLVTTACGSLREDIKPGDLVILSDFIDRTTKRMQTFYDINALNNQEGCGNAFSGICHLPMFPAFNESVRHILNQSAKELFKSEQGNYNQGTVHEMGTVVTIEGPRFSSRAESKMFRQWGADLVNMTTCPEVVLAKEAGLLYGCIAIATDYDSWRTDCAAVNVQDVLKTFASNVIKVKQMLVKAVQLIAKEQWDKPIHTAQVKFKI